MKKILSMTVLSLSLLVLLIPTPNSYAGVGSITVYSEDFESGLIPPEFVDVNLSENIEGTQGYSGLGFGDNFLRNTSGLPNGPEGVNPTTLVLNNLACHTSVDINFYAAIIDSWDGFNGNPGPDSFLVIVDANTKFSEVFESASGTQTYENPPTAITLAFKQGLGFSGFLDSAYNLGLDSRFDSIPHTSSTLTIAWIASPESEWQGGADESWAIDNIEVILNGIDDPSCVTTPPPPPPPPLPPVVGGEIIPIESTSLILAGAQSFSWMLPVVLSALGIGLFVLRKSENS